MPAALAKSSRNGRRCLRKTLLHLQCNCCKLKRNCHSLIMFEGSGTHQQQQLANSGHTTAGSALAKSSRRHRHSLRSPHHTCSVAAGCRNVSDMFYMCPIHGEVHTSSDCLPMHHSHQSSCFSPTEHASRLSNEWDSMEKHMIW